jgi:hypothetical protein
MTLRELLLGLLDHGPDVSANWLDTEVAIAVPNQTRKRHLKDAELLEGQITLYAGDFLYPHEMNK